MGPDYDDLTDEAYFDTDARPARVFDARLLRQPLDILATRKPIVLSPHDSVTEAMRAMQREHRGCVLITSDGTTDTPLLGIFTERDVLLKIVDRGRNPAVLPLAEVMTPDPECLVVSCSIAWVLNRMSAGGFRHVPAVDERRCPVSVVSVRDVVDFLVDHFPREVQNLPPAPGPAGPDTREGA